MRALDDAGRRPVRLGDGNLEWVALSASYTMKSRNQWAFTMNKLHSVLGWQSGAYDVNPGAALRPRHGLRFIPGPREDDHEGLVYGRRGDARGGLTPPWCWRVVPDDVRLPLGQGNVQPDPVVDDDYVWQTYYTTSWSTVRISSHSPARGRGGVSRRSDAGVNVVISAATLARLRGRDREAMGKFDVCR